MANTKKYLSHLLQNTGITPACSEEERAAADVIAKIFTDHGFTPEIQEFSASGMPKVVQAGLGIAAFVGAVLAGIGGAVGIVGLLLVIAAAVLFVLERSGKPVLSGLGSGGLSQNVIAYHKASGPLASPRNRPVVVVAHYDSPREDLLAREPFAAYRPLIVKLLPAAMVAPAVLCVVRMLPVPDPAKIVMWVLAVVAALIPLAYGVSVIANRFVLPYTTGSVTNKSSVAAMLGVMDAVAPYELGEEFPHDTPADEYFAEQQRILDEAIAQAEAAAAAEAEAAMAYPHELEKADEVEGSASDVDDAAVDATAAEPSAPMDLDSTSAMFAADVVDGATGVMPAVASEAAMAAGAAAAAAVEAGVAAGQVAAQPAAPGSADVTMTSMPAVGDTQVVEMERAFQDIPAVEDAPRADAVALDADQVSATAVVSAPVQEGADAVPTLEPVPVESEGDALNAGAQASLDLDAAEPEDKPAFYLNAAGNVRFGAETIRGLGMLPETCAVVYEAAPADEDEQPTAFDTAAPEALYTDEVHTVSDLFEDESAGASEELAEDEGTVVDEELAYDEEPIEAFEPLAPESDDALLDDSEVMTPADVAEVEAFDAAPDDFDVIMEAEYEVIEDEDEGDAPSGAALDATAVQDFTVEAEADAAGVAAGEDDDVSSELDQTVAASPLMQDAALLAAAHPVNLQDSMTFEMPEPSGSPAPAPEEAAPEQANGDENSEPDLSSTVAMPMPAAARPVDTVDMLMAEIDRSVPARPARTINVPSTADAPAPHTPASANRASLFDLPDPSSSPVDPFASMGTAAFGATTGAAQPEAGAEAARSAFTVINASEASSPAPVEEQPFETITAPAPEQGKPRRGLGRIFGRKKGRDDSMSEWLGVDDSFDAKKNGHDIGSWDNFDDDGWKGGAAGFDGATEDELREAITSMGDDELLGHDIWFVATGASENGNAGIRAFLDAHRSKLRGVFLINLESVGAGQVAMLATEGEQRVLKGDKRIMKLVQRVSSDFHHEYPAVDMPYVTTDAHAAMSMSLRSLTLAGVEGTGFALSHTEEDQPYNLDTDNVSLVADVVTEVIRRS